MKIERNIEIVDKKKSAIDCNRLTNGQKKYMVLKRGIDIVMSGGAVILFSPILIIISAAIKIESPGPVLFKQKRVGKNKELFEIWKFRSMRTDTPKDIPTHMLENPDEYITKVGKFLRKTSLDELPQIFNILKGEMSIIGPRPALWNQDDLIDARDKYGANDIMPGLTGWAQINGRDELEIPVKAWYDGEYVKKMGIFMDAKCFLGTIGSVLCSDGVVEGGTGKLCKSGVKTDNVVSEEKLKKEIYTGVAIVGAGLVAGVSVLTILIRWWETRCVNNKTERKTGFLTRAIMGIVFAEAIATIFVNIKRRVRMADEFATEEDLTNSMKEEVLTKKKKRILITGAGSYIGTSVEFWLSQYPDTYQIDTLDMQNESWREKDFSEYDVVYHVAGIAHADVGTVSEEQKKMYYKVNADLAVETAEKAKKAGVRQFIFMSSMIVYSGCKEKVIHADTIPKPLNFYGDSKWQADQKIRQFADENFKVAVLRPPMIYGKGSKGNYPELAKLASKLPVFPIVKNKRSMLHIDNLCEFVRLIIDEEETGVFYPQNGEYTNTSDMVQMIAAVRGHRIIMIPGTNLVVRLMGRIPGRVGQLAEKAFGDSAYDMTMSEYKRNYRINSLRKSVELTEGTEDE